MVNDDGLSLWYQE